LKLFILRKRYEISQYDLTVYLGIDQKTYHNIENDITLRIRKDIIIKLAFLYDISIDYLLGITNKRNRFPKDLINKVIEEYNIDLRLVDKLRQKSRI